MLSNSYRLFPCRHIRQGLRSDYLIFTEKSKGQRTDTISSRGWQEPKTKAFQIYIAKAVPDSVQDGPHAIFSSMRQQAPAHQGESLVLNDDVQL